MFKDLPYFKKQGNICIVGGTGRMGQWALKLFTQLGYRNLFFSGNPEKAQNIDEKIRAQFIEDNRELTKISDFLIVSVPIDKTINVIDEIGPHIKKESIFSDFTSVKKNPCERMRKYSDYAIGIHPMFKETVKTLEGKNIIITPTIPEIQNERIEFLKKIFGETAAKIRIISPENHDKITSFNQAGVHLLLISYGNLLKTYCRKHNLNLNDLEALNTPNSQLMNLLLGRFLGTGNYNVMWGIQNTTKESENMRKLLKETLEKIIKDFDDGDKEQFEKDLESISRKFKKDRVLMQSEDSDKLVFSLKEFGSEKHFKDLLKESQEILEQEIKEKFEGIGIFNPQRNLDPKLVMMFEKIERFYSEIEENFKENKLKEARNMALMLQRIIEKTLLKGKKRMQHPIKGNTDKIEKIEGAIHQFTQNCNKLISMEKLIPKD